MAGDSAREVARRMREKSERLARAADAWERGADGEDATARALAALPPEYVVLHDLRWPGRQRANIDHVVVGPTGVFVVDSKNWSGTVRVKDGVLRQNGYSREQSVAGAAEAALAVARVVAPLPVSLVVPVLCLVRDEEVGGQARDVVLCSTATVVRTITERPLVLGPSAHHAALRDIDRSQRRTATSPASSWPGPRGPVPTRPDAGPRRLVRALVALALVVVGGAVLTNVMTGAVQETPAAETEVDPGTARAEDATRWVGTYRCNGVVRPGRLDAWVRPDGRVAADFRFGSTARASSSVPGGRYRLVGDVRDGRLVLEPTGWVEQPSGFSMVGFEAGAPSRGVLTGDVRGADCSTFRFRRR